MATQTTTPPAAPSIADPGPLGLAAFALTTFVLSIFNARIVDVTLEPVVLPLALFYGGIVQVFAGMWEFKRNNTFAALAFSSYGAFWMSFAGYVKFVAPGLDPAIAHQATGVFLLAWTLFTLYMTVVTFRINVGLMLTFVVLSVTFICLAIGAFGPVEGATRLGGYLGIVTALLAWYCSFAGVINDTWKKTVLPMGPLAKKPTQPAEPPMAGRETLNPPAPERTRV